MEGRWLAQDMGEAGRAVAHRPYLALIDGVRGMAALSVLFYHYVHFFMTGPDRHPQRGAIWLFPGNDWLWPVYAYGQFAVQVFWLISGFVFAHVYDDRKASTRSFAVNRIARLYPLHLLTLLVVTALQSVALYRLGYTPIYSGFDWQHFVAQLFMVSDWLQAGGYSFNGPIWSVSVEIAIYAVFWLTLGLARRFGMFFTAALAAASVFASHEWGAWSSVFSCGQYFFAGCTLSILREGRLGKRWPLRLLALLLVAIGFGATVHWGMWGWQKFGLIGIFGGLFLLLAQWQNSAPEWLNRICKWLGESTYGVYLWHFPIQLSLMLVLMPAIKTQDIARNGWFLALYLILVIVVGRISYIWFERPARDAVRRRLGGGTGAPKRG